MSKLLVRNSRKYAVQTSFRTFSSYSQKREEEPILNRYSRIVTQPKVQGASQVSVKLDEPLDTIYPFGFGYGLGDALCH
jgi:hypothetical protein